MPHLRRSFIAAKVGFVQEAARSRPCSKQRRRSGLASILITALFITLCLAIPAHAQSNTASLSGRAFDPAHHSVPNAQILITNTDLNTKRTVISDSNGDFRADRLPPGAFTLEAEAPNLKTRRPVRLTLGLGSTVHVDLALAIPTVTQKSTVTSRGATSEGNTLAPPVNREEASVSSFFTGNTVTYLPNRDRDYTQFGQLGGGISEDPSENGLVVAGQRSTGRRHPGRWRQLQRPAPRRTSRSIRRCISPPPNHSPRVPDRPLRRHRRRRRHQRRPHQRRHQGRLQPPPRRGLLHRAPRLGHLCRRLRPPPRQPPKHLRRSPTAAPSATIRSSTTPASSRTSSTPPTYLQFAPQAPATALPTTSHRAAGPDHPEQYPRRHFRPPRRNLQPEEHPQPSLVMNRVRSSNIGDRLHPHHRHV